LEKIKISHYSLLNLYIAPHTTNAASTQRPI